MTGSNGEFTAAILNGVGAQATFQNTAGQVVVVTSNSAGTTTIPISGSGEPTIPSGSALTVVSNDPNIPSTSSSGTTAGDSSAHVRATVAVLCGCKSLSCLQASLVHVVIYKGCLQNTYSTCYAAPSASG